MTVTSTTNKVIYTGNGAVSVYAYPFKIYDESDLIVTRITIATGAEAVLTLTTDYTVSGEGNPNGGDVTLVAGNLSALYKLVIQRRLPLTQEVEYVPNDPFPATVHQETIDRLIMIAQQQQEEINRSIKVPITESDSDVDIMEIFNDGVAGAEAAATAAAAAQAEAETAQAAAEAAQAAAVAASAAIPNFTGMIVMWSGTIATIPAGWALCNGANGTPDLRNRMIVCANADAGGAAKTTITGVAAQTGGAASVVLDKGNIPAHVHAYASASQNGGCDGSSSPFVNQAGNTGNGVADGLKVVPDAVSLLNPFYALAYIMKT